MCPAIWQQSIITINSLCNLASYGYLMILIHPDKLVNSTRKYILGRVTSS